MDKGLEPFKKRLRREVTLSDVQRLTELKFIRISRYDSDKADNEIRRSRRTSKATQYDIDHLTEYAVAYYERIRDKYGKGRERRTEMREFDNIEATKVAVTNAKLYVDRAEGFFGIGKSMKDAGVRMRLLGHRRRDRLHEGRPLRHHQGRATRPSSRRASTTSGSSSATTSARSTTCCTATARTARS